MGSESGAETGSSVKLSREQIDALMNTHRAKPLVPGLETPQVASNQASEKVVEETEKKAEQTETAPTTGARSFLGVLGKLRRLARI